jgi:cell wall-associated NlpC family hydrolase
MGEATPTDWRAPWRSALAGAVLALGLGVAGCGPNQQQRPAPREPVLTPSSVRGVHRERGSELRSQGHVVRFEGAGVGPQRGVSGGSAPSPGAPSDKQVRAELALARRELRDFKSHLDTTASLKTGSRARVLRDGTAQAPAGAPSVVKRVILAANEIAKFPYKWGGGHGSWRDSGYDCSGSVSFALAGAGLLDRPLASGGFMRWGADGPGRWITIYANSGHIFMFVAGLRFDTSGQGRAGTRWQDATRSTAGFAVRHPPRY